MSKESDWQVSKWPFLTAAVLMMGAAVAAVFVLPPPVSHVLLAVALAVFGTGAVVACVPFYLEYQGTGQLLEANAVGSVADQLQDLKHYSEQISTATERWAAVQETTKGHADKTTTAAREIAERMAQEIREFNEFQVKLNDTEKGALRLEVEKLRRAEAEWMQAVARILDHIFALHNAASRSGNPELAEQIGQFQLACRDAARRVGLTLFGAEAGEPFDAKKHRAQGVESPAADAAVAETLAPGVTYQGRLVRHVLVQLKTPAAPAGAEPAEPSEATGPTQATLEALEEK